MKHFKIKSKVFFFVSKPNKKKMSDEGSTTKEGKRKEE